MLFETIQQIVSNHFSVPPEKLTPDTLLAEDLGADSLDYVDLSIDFEDAFDIEIEEEEMLQFKTLKDIEIYLLNSTTL